MEPAGRSARRRDQRKFVAGAEDGASPWLHGDGGDGLAGCRGRRRRRGLAGCRGRRRSRVRAEEGDAVREEGEVLSGLPDFRASGKEETRERDGPSGETLQPESEGPEPAHGSGSPQGGGARVVREAEGPELSGGDGARPQELQSYRGRAQRLAGSSGRRRLSISFPAGAVEVGQLMRATDTSPQKETEPDVHRAPRGRMGTDGRETGPTYVGFKMAPIRVQFVGFKMGPGRWPFSPITLVPLLSRPSDPRARGRE